MNYPEAVAVDNQACAAGLAATAHINNAELQQLLAYAFHPDRRGDGGWTAKQYAVSIATKFQTVSSRFHRAKSPAPKRILALAMLVRVTALAAHRLSVYDCAGVFQISSGQSLGRMIKTYLGCAFSELREPGLLQKAITLLVEESAGITRDAVLERCPHCGKLS